MKGRQHSVRASPCRWAFRAPLDPTASSHPQPGALRFSRAGGRPIFGERHHCLWASASFAQPHTAEALLPDPPVDPLGTTAAVEPATTQAVPESSPAYRSEVERVWFEEGPRSGAGAVRGRALALGMRNLDVAARALISAPGGDGNRLSKAMLAVRLAPDLPVAHLALARANREAGNLGDALGEVVAAVRAVPGNLEASAWLVGSLIAVAAVVLVIAPIFFIACVGVGAFGRSAHDLGDLISMETPGFARTALSGVLLLLPLLMGEGLGGVLLVLFALGLVYGSSSHRMALVLAAALLLMGLYPVTRVANTVLAALDADPVASAALAVVQSADSRADIELLESVAGEDFLAAHALALKARFAGRSREASERYAALALANPDEPVVLTNYANLLFAAGEGERAVELYERAATSTDSPRLMFNLSQAYAGLFRIEEFESALSAAQSLNAEQVADLSRVGDGNFVADLPVPISPLRTRMLAAGRAVEPPRDAVALLLPGRLGASWFHALAGFVLTAVAALMVSIRCEQASSCIRCGKRICSRCDDKEAAQGTCDPCHHLFHRPETTDPSLRMARLTALQKRERLLGRLGTLASLAVPGVAGLLARRPDLGFLGVLFFVSAGILLGVRGGVVADPLTLGSIGSLAFYLAGSAAAIAYLVVVGTGLTIRRGL